MDIRKKLENALRDNDKERAASIVLDALEEGFSLVELYEDVFAKILNGIECGEDDHACIWVEHQMTSIVRTLVSMTYSYVLKQKKKVENPKHALIVCPRMEYHDLGAVVGAHFLELVGFKSTYVGANTPLRTIDNALKALDVDFLVISVSNAYHLFEAQKVIEHVQKHFPSVRLVGAGRGFQHEKDKFHELAYVLERYESVVEMARKEGV